AYRRIGQDDIEVGRETRDRVADAVRQLDRNIATGDGILCDGERDARCFNHAAVALLAVVREETPHVEDFLSDDRRAIQHLAGRLLLAVDFALAVVARIGSDHIILLLTLSDDPRRGCAGGLYATDSDLDSLARDYGVRHRRP